MTALGSRETLKDPAACNKYMHEHGRSYQDVSFLDLDHRQAATLGLAMVANESRFVHSALSKIVDELRSYPHASLLDYDIELL